PLFASLTAEDAGAIITQLKAAKTPYRVGGAGEQILVPADRVNEIRLRAAVQGLPLGGGVGFEVFDRTTFGVSDFSQRVNYQRALQGELARTIGQLREVARARIHLALPQPSVFAERERPASASVFLKLKPGQRLSADQIRGIVQLVASSVEGLTADRVTVMDTAGGILAAGADAAGSGPLSPRRLEIKTAVEDGLERRVQSLLDAALGVGQAVTRVSAQLSFDQVERTEERFDPNPVARQKSRTVESNKTSSSSPTGAPAAAGQTAAPPPASVSSNEGSRESQSESFELSRIVAKTLTTPGDIRRLSVAVLLKVPSRAPQGADSKAPPQAQPRAAEEIEKIQKIVMGAVGFSEQRGDQVTVVEMPFEAAPHERELPAAPEAAPPPASPLSMPVLAAAGGALLLLIAGFVVWLLKRRSRQQQIAAVGRSLQSQEPAAAGATPGRRPVPVEQPASMELPEEFARLGRERDGLRQQALGIASAEPEAAAQLIRAWMVKKKSLVPAGGGSDVE
ncbi:MAG: flagellar M-ring protein FliF, partial [Candidatus Rokubacteria bacterium GWC2_70_24]